METAPLKSFATSARTELIREVAARITAVLAQGSPERIEQPKAVTALERTIASAGGGDKGKSHVADKVAYTWFNRIIALRFMDANGYTGIGVVSPAADHVGQPEVLSAAKRGQVDTEVVRGANSATITGLLNGTRQPRPGVDAQAEAYALLLADYCRFWNAAMPFMFEREGDYTELLIPANLLAEDSVLSRSVTVLTDDVCQDVEVIGWLYQFYISERKDEVFAGFKKNKKAGADEIPAATQLFTPHWIVRYLVENSLGRLWMLNRPASGLASQMEYYIAPVEEETDFLKVSKPEELKVIDPACGSGHILTYAFDVLYAIYEEEGYAPSEIPGLILTNNLYGTEIDPRAGALAAFALTMKATGRRKLFLKNPVEPNVCVLDPISFSPGELEYLVTKDGDRHAEEQFWNQFAGAATFGSLITPDPALVMRLARHLEAINDDGDMYKADALDWAWQVIRQAEILLPKYAVVVANPPYMGAKNMSPSLAEYLAEHFPDSKADLMTAFMERALGLTEPNGYAALINLPSWMFISSFSRLREKLIRRAYLAQLVHLGRGVFGSDFGSVAFVLENRLAKDAECGLYRRLFDRHVQVRTVDAIRETFLEPAVGRNFANQYDFLAVPGAPIAYWLSSGELDLYRQGKLLKSVATTATGIQTSDNETFLRRWFEVSRNRSRTSSILSERKWVPIEKGGEFRRWYGNKEFVVNWEGNGQEIRARESWPRNKSRVSGDEYFFRSGITWSRITIGRFSARLSSGDSIFDNAGSSLFSDAHLQPLLGMLNSRVADRYLEFLAPTLNTQPGDIDRLPVTKELLDSGGVVEECIQIARSDWDSSELSWDFGRPELLSCGDGRLMEAVREFERRWDARVERLRELETANNRAVIESYPMPTTANPEVALAEVSLLRNRVIRDGSESESRRRLVGEFVSYAVGCMFGRYSLDEPGLILADQGGTLQDYLVTVASPTFVPDADNVIPIVDGDWFEDDVVGLFRRFLRTAFGDQHFEENLKFVTESLGVRSLRDYFLTRAGRSKFYDDHVQRYKKRPIYWLFSSPKGSFNALIYMHRYTPSTVSTVLTYLREYVTKLESALQQAERAGIAKEADRLRKILVELNEYEHDTLYPTASQNFVIDLDDGVKVNYPKFGAALRKIAGLESSSD